MRYKKKLPKYSIGGSVLSGAASGAAAGSVAGPWGTVIGGVVGAAGGLFSGLSAKKAKKQQDDLQQQQFERQFDLQQEQFDFQKRQANIALASQIDAQKMQADTINNANALAMQAENTKKLAGIDTAGTLRDFNIFKNGGFTNMKKRKYMGGGMPLNQLLRQYENGGMIKGKNRISSPQEREFYQSDLKYLYGDYGGQSNYQSAVASPERYSKGIENAVRQNDLEAAKRLHSQLKRFRPDIYEGQLHDLRKNILSPEQYMELLIGEVTPENTAITTPKASLKFMQMGGNIDGDGKKKKKEDDYGGLFEVIGDDTGTQSIDTGVKNLDAFYSPIREKVNMFIQNNPDVYNQATGTFRNLESVLNNPNLLIDEQGQTYESKQRSAPSLDDPNVRKLQGDILELIDDDTLRKLSKKDLTGSSKAGAIRKLASALGWDSFKVPGIVNRIQEYSDQGYTFKYGGKIGCKKKSRKRLDGSLTLDELIKYSK